MKRISPIIAFAAMGALAMPVLAQDAYQVDILELVGTNSLILLPDPEFSIAEAGTIEFWIQPDWEETPEEDPVILSYVGQAGISYVVAMTAEKDALEVFSGDDGIEIPFDFDDGKMHHIALNSYGTDVAVIADGELLDVTPLVMEDLSPTGFYVGSLDGTQMPFIGAIGALRVWGVPVEPEQIAEFRFRDVLSENDGFHPDIDYLQAISDFADEDVLIVTEEE